MPIENVKNSQGQGRLFEDQQRSLILMCFAIYYKLDF